MAPVRVASSDPVPPAEALQALKDGNARYVASQTPKVVQQGLRQELSDNGQLPMVAVVGCADSRCPPEVLFDQLAGDVFVLRNAGNTVTQNEGSVVASLEYCIGPLKTQLVLVLGHTKCGAIKGATSMVGEDGKIAKPSQNAGVLEKYLIALAPTAKQAKAELKPGATADEIAAHAVKVNVFHTVDRILEYSEPFRKAVSAGVVEVHGAVYDIDTGKVEFLGESPRQALILDSRTDLHGGAKDTLVGA